MVFTAPLALLLLGLAAIVWGTKIVLDNAIRIARHHDVSDFFIGVVVLSIGSDLPELVVTLDAALRQLANEDTANLIVGNMIGSCFGQLGLVIGLAGLIGRLSLSRTQVIRHGSALVGATLLLMLVGLDGRVGRIEGMILLIAFAAYIVFVLNEERSASSDKPVSSDRTLADKVTASWLRLGLGLAVVVVSAELIVRTAMTLAVQWGVDQSFIGIAIVGVGTSLPEVVISIAAVFRNRIALSVGNLIGSNILDTLVPIGLAAMIVPLSFDPSLLAFDLPMLLGLTLLVLVLLYLRSGVRWPQAAVVLAAYLSYLVTITRAL